MNRWVTWALQALLLAVMGGLWQASQDSQAAIVDLKITLAKQATNIEALTKAAETATSNRYTSQQAAADWRTQKIVDQNQERDIYRNAAQVDILLDRLNAFLERMQSNGQPNGWSE